MEASKIRLTVPEGIDPSRVLGAGDGVLRALESLVRAHVVARGDSIAVSGDPDEVELVARFFEHAFREAAAGRTLSADDVSRCLAVLRDGEHEATSLRDDVLLSYRGRAIRPKTLGQKRYVDAIRSHTITFGLGPAGTGKTYLARALAVAALKRHEVGRLVLTRPVVEAGENLGFLPGTLEEKIDPYMRPLYDALFDMMDRERTDELMERGVRIGADVPYCILRGTALSEGIGEVLTKLPAVPQCQVLVAKPGINVSTKFVYENLHANDLRPEQHPDIDGMIQAIKDQDLKKIAGKLGNVLETVTVKEYPVIQEIKDKMLEFGAIGSLMSGSGPTVFGLFTNPKAAQEAYEELRYGESAELAKQVYLTNFYNQKEENNHGKQA